MDSRLFVMIPAFLLCMKRDCRSDRGLKGQKAGMERLFLLLVGAVFIMP